MQCLEQVVNEGRASRGNSSMHSVEGAKPKTITKRRLNAKSIAFMCLVVPLLIVIYTVVSAQGMRLSIPVLGIRISRLPLPGFSYLAHYQNVRDLDLAHLFAMLMLFVEWLLGTVLVQNLLFGVRSDGRLNAARHDRFLYCLSAMVFLCDLAMFYRGIADEGAGLLDNSVGLTPAIATIGYAGLLMFVAYYHVRLREEIH